MDDLIIIVYILYMLILVSANGPFPIREAQWVKTHKQNKNERWLCLGSVPTFRNAPKRLCWIHLFLPSIRYLAKLFEKKAIGVSASKCLQRLIVVSFVVNERNGGCEGLKSRAFEGLVYISWLFAQFIYLLRWKHIKVFKRKRKIFPT